ncbi:MAG: MarR family transcriptional regulator [Pseudomonadota bacterium]|nr:MarR family transcriptional regulator [Pseudomonadota bacterium]
MARALELRLGPAADALDRFEAAWNRTAEGRAVQRLDILTLGNLPLLIKTLTPARWSLLERLRAKGPSSIYELARRLQRDYKNVHTDVARLIELGLIERKENLVAVVWDVVRAELRFG